MEYPSKTVEAITNFLFIGEEKEQLKKSDLVIVLGNHIIDIMMGEISDLYQSGKITKEATIILSGATGDMTKGQALECDQMYESAVEKYGMPANLFLKEPQATNAYLNMVYAKDLILEQGGFENYKHILCVGNSFLLRRASMYASKLEYPMEQMQFFGARCNLAKTLLYAINGGRDEISGKQVAPKFEPVTSEYLDYDDVMYRFDNMMEYVAKIYIKALNAIHYMHDKYSYEKIEMALHDETILRTMATGIAGLSVVADSLSAIKYAKVKPVRNETGLVVSYEIEGDFPKYGNDDDRVDAIAVDVLKRFMKKIRKQKTYRNAKPTMSVLTITSNVVYGKNTGDTPDGRKAGEPFGPGANPMHGRDTHGALAVMNSVAKLPYEHAEDGISYTFSIF